MPPKKSPRSKSRSSKKSSKSKKHSKDETEVKIPDYWLDDLNNLKINDSEWRCNVTLLVENSNESSIYVDHFNEASVTGLRKDVKTINKLDVVKCATQNCVENSKHKKLTPFSKLCSEIYKFTKVNYFLPIPLFLLAPLIKYMIIFYKEKNIEQNKEIMKMRQEMEAGDEELFASGKPGKKGDSKSGKSPKKGSVTGKKGKEEIKIKEDKKSPGKDKKIKDKDGKKSQGKDDKKKGKSDKSEKKYTKLLKRGEEWKGVELIDDAPMDGPQLYVVISTMLDHDLPLELIKLDVPLNAIVELQADKDDLARLPKYSECLSIDSYPQLRTSSWLSVLREFKRKSSPHLKTKCRTVIEDENAYYEEVKEGIDYFWQNFKGIVNDLNYAPFFKDVIMYSFLPVFNDATLDPADTQKELYDQISFLLYDLHNVTEEYKRYRSEIKILDLQDENIVSLSEMGVYNKLLDAVPHEIITVPYIVHCILAQVEETRDGVVPSCVFFEENDSVTLKESLLEEEAVEVESIETGAQLKLSVKSLPASQTKTVTSPSRSRSSGRKRKSSGHSERKSKSSVRSERKSKRSEQSEIKSSVKSEKISAIEYLSTRSQLSNISSKTKSSTTPYVIPYGDKLSVRTYNYEIVGSYVKENSDIVLQICWKHKINRYFENEKNTDLCSLLPEGIFTNCTKNSMVFVYLHMLQLKHMIDSNFFIKTRLLFTKHDTEGKSMLEVIFENENPDEPCQDGEQRDSLNESCRSERKPDCSAYSLVNYFKESSDNSTSIDSNFCRPYKVKVTEIDDSTLTEPKTNLMKLDKMTHIDGEYFQTPEEGKVIGVGKSSFDYGGKEFFKFLSQMEKLRQIIVYDEQSEEEKGKVIGVEKSSFDYGGREFFKFLSQMEKLRQIIAYDEQSEEEGKVIGVEKSSFDFGGREFFKFLSQMEKLRQIIAYDEQSENLQAASRFTEKLLCFISPSEMDAVDVSGNENMTFESINLGQTPSRLLENKRVRNGGYCTFYDVVDVVLRFNMHKIKDDNMEEENSKLSLDSKGRSCTAKSMSCHPINYEESNLIPEQTESDEISMFTKSENISKEISVNSIDINIALLKEYFPIKYAYFEELSVRIMVQTLQNLLSQFNSNVIRYCPVSDQLIVMFYDGFQKGKRVHKECWTARLTTDIGSRDFVEYTLDEESSWLEAERNRLLQEELARNPPTVFEMGYCASAYTAMLDSLYPSADFISHRSLKFEKLVEELREKEKPELPPKGKRSRSKSKTGRSSSTKSDRGSKGSKKTKKGKDKSQKQTEKKAPESKKEIKTKEARKSRERSFKKEKQFAFVGYDLGLPVRMQFSGVVKQLDFENLCKITYKLTKRLYGHERVSIEVEKCGHTLYYHSLSEQKHVRYFHIVHSSGIVVYFTNADVVPSKASPREEHVNGEEYLTVKNNVTPVESEDALGPNETELRNLRTELPCRLNLFTDYNMKISLPTGLWIEPVLGPEFTYVRQTYFNRGPLTNSIKDEEYRCVLENGSVVKYMKNGRVIVLCPNSTIYTLKKIKWPGDLKESITEMERISKGSKQGGDLKESIEVERKSGMDKISKGSKQGGDLKESTEIERKSGMDKISRGSKQGGDLKESIEIERKSGMEKISLGSKQGVTSSTSEQSRISQTKVTQFEVVLTTGERLIFNDDVSEEDTKLLTFSTTDIFNDNTLLNRADAVKVIHLYDGSIVVDFPDGTRTTSFVTTDCEELFCDWDLEEYSTWFAKRPEPNDEQCTSEKSARTQQQSDWSLSKYTVSEISSREKENELVCFPSVASTAYFFDIKEEGYVVVNLNYKIEHPNYATVYFNDEDKEIELCLPFELNIHLSEESYVVQSGNETRVHVYGDEIVYEKINEQLECDRRTEIQLSNLNKPILSTTDFSGNTITISKKGRISKFANVKKHKHLRCFVINRDCDGYEILNTENVRSHVNKVKDELGLVENYTKTNMTNILTCVEMKEVNVKWLKDFDKLPDTRLYNCISTFGDEGWAHPFKTKHERPPRNFSPDIVLFRVFNKLSTKHQLLDFLLAHLINLQDGTDCEFGEINTDEFLIESLTVDNAFMSDLYAEAKTRHEQVTDSCLNDLKENAVKRLLHRMIFENRKYNRRIIAENNRYALLNGITPPYFETPSGQLYFMLGSIVDGIEAEADEREKTVTRQSKFKQLVLKYFRGIKVE